MKSAIENSFQRLKNYLEAPPLSERYMGYDPFDGLNSPTFQNSILNKSRFLKIAWLQLHKNSPVNFRRFFRVEVGYNPQALGLFISSYCNLYKSEQNEDDLLIIRFLAEKLLSLKSRGWSGACWGYNFDWQARAFFLPKFTPMIASTSFAVNGLFDAYEILKSQHLLDAAVSSGNFIMKDLNRTYEDNLFAFSYSPLDNTVVYNATLLGSQVLSRIYAYTKEDHFKQEAAKTVQFCLNHQKTDGSWPYGTKSYHKWTDNFHSGYNLTCLSDYGKFTGDNSVHNAIHKGLDYYLNTFFEPSGRAKYYSNRIFPVDINNPAQLIITLSKLGMLKDMQPLADKVLNWTIANMQDKKGYFYYQKYRFYKIKIPYIRWSQAWMFYALTTYLNILNEK